jgi:hypothetical protein
MRHDLQLVLRAATELPADEIARFLGELEEIRVTAMARLIGPAPSHPQQHDELMATAKAAHRLGVSKDYLYRNHHNFSFTRRVGRRLLFSTLGIEKYIRQQRHVDSNTAQRYLQAVGTSDQRLKV